jgi:hypothetical protein
MTRALLVIAALCSSGLGVAKVQENTGAAPIDERLHRK